MKKTSPFTQYEMRADALLSKAEIAIAKARRQHCEALARMREAYSFPVRTGFWWFKRERPATPDEIDKRLANARRMFSVNFDFAYVTIWGMADDVKQLEKLVAAAQVDAVEKVFVSQDDMDTINKYLQ